MEIFINEETSISDIKKQFNAKFPFLKLEFFKVPHKPGEGTPLSLMISDDKKIGEVSLGGSRGRIYISKVMTVNELEQKFQDVFGINVQVFRKSGGFWLQTTATDSWTLLEQNLQGEDMENKIEINN